MPHLDPLSARGPRPEVAQQAADDRSVVAYFTMEVALDRRLPTYAGGLGVLAGDVITSAADVGMPFVGVTLLYRDGYFAQSVDGAGRQVEAPVAWRPSDLLDELPERVVVDVGGERVTVGAWRLVVGGHGGRAGVPVIFLDTNLPENGDSDRDITDQLYGGDAEHRLRQEAVLGLGGHAMLGRLGYHGVTRFHMNEGHAALLTLAELEERGAASSPSAAEVAEVRARCVFTTHTPVAAGHDRFPEDLVKAVLGEQRLGVLEAIGVMADGCLNMTTLGTALSGYVNAVSRRHATVAKAMMPTVDVASITNGVHHVRWTSPSMQSLLDEHLSGWRAESALLRYAGELPLEGLAAAHRRSKEVLLGLVAEATGTRLGPEVLTIGFARRITPYKRALLFLSDPERLAAIASRCGGLQFVCSGKAHPKDEEGRKAVSALVSAAGKTPAGVTVVFLEDYDLGVAAAVCAGSDVWLNTPRRPLEASGTSGMKAALNGVPSLSILDGWWIEGCVEGVTGWAIGDDEVAANDAPGEVAGDDAGDASLSHQDAAAFYAKLETAVVPLFYDDPDGYLRVRRSALALNGSFFTSERVVREYALEAYGLAPSDWRSRPG